MWARGSCEGLKPADVGPARGLLKAERGLMEVIWDY